MISLHFIDEEIEIQRGWEICKTFHSDGHDNEPEALFVKSEYQQPYSQHREPSLKLCRHLTGLRAPKFHTQIQDLDVLWWNN